ncbi:hypothetical protein HYPDE_30643 [Hyphomicrobium denitrificans 1NES1]|uniref:Uncharacterized protein n=1 Tax=Hyphomicrobium denitrificans 1NES1 TaxID=670307 RepID=N0B471_9HYPH|nr:hypothetical protein HYPDE_30643 [Hyphomicrobium denitrificans 1NES1]
MFGGRRINIDLAPKAAPTGRSTRSPSMRGMDRGMQLHCMNIFMNRQAVKCIRLPHDPRFGFARNDLAGARMKTAYAARLWLSPRDLLREMRLRK